MWFDSTHAGSDVASPSLGEGFLLRQNENRLEFIPILVRRESGVVKRGRDDCGSIPHALDQVMLLSLSVREDFARSVRIRT